MFDKLKEVFSIPLEESTDITISEIKDGIKFTGHNMWLLFFAMIMACVGLNNNNLTAIIGAMLISPLMGPVVGIAFGMSVSDKAIIRSSFKNYIAALALSLISSTLFFILTPFNNTTSVLNDYTHPTIFDVLLALFGGLAGFLGIIKKDGTKVIAGVAVATACMPPLCSAGYGLANQNWEMFFGGLYFYIINSFFIGVGSQILIRWMRIPQLSMQQSKKNKLDWVVSVLSLILILPSIWIAYDKWQQQKLNQDSKAYVEQIKSKHPELVVVNYEGIIDAKGKDYLHVSLLNDSASVDQSLLRNANKLNKMEIIWHFTPNANAGELQQLRLKVENLETQINLLKKDF